MKAITKFLAGGVAIVAVASAAPAAAQYYPGYGGYGYPYGGGNVVGQVLNQVLGGGYGYNGYGNNSQAVVNICASAIQQRLNGGYGYRYGNAYGYGGARVLGITSIEQRGSGGGGLRVRGVATSGRYGYGQGPDLTWKCSVDYRGAIVGLDVNRDSYGYGNYTPYNYDYSQYGYRRY